MAAWKLPPIVLALALPIVAGFLLGGPAVGVALGALAVLVLLLVAARMRPRGPIGEPAADGRRRVLVVATAPIEEPAAVSRLAREAGLGEGAEPAAVRVLAPASIGFLDRWASDVEDARRAAQESLVATVAALAKAGVEAEARVGDEDVVQAIEDQLGTYPASEVVLVSVGDEESGRADAAEELRTRLRPEFRELIL